jgi:heptosyltransferase-3
MTEIALPANARILVVALRRLGDVLLTTPLIRSLKRAYPAAAIEALVFADTAAILAGNPDLSGTITMPEPADARQTLALARRLWRRYDIAISIQTGDRPTLFAWAAGRISVGAVRPAGVAARFKRAMLTRAVVADPGRHQVLDLLALAQPLGVPAAGEIVCPSGPVRTALLPDCAYAVVHAAPMYRYKQWTADGWRALADALAERGLLTVATGGPADRAYLDGIWGPDVLRRDGALSWPELAALIRGAQVYVGPDTAVSHLAAATGAPTVALYGPTDPRQWGPWPVGGLDRPWAGAGTIQRRGNVWLVQNPLPCLPCQQEGCLRRRDSFSQCLDELPLARVVTAIDQAIAQSRSAAGRRQRDGAPV